MKAIALGAAMALVPVTILAETDPVLRVTVSDNYVPEIHVRAGAGVDIAMPDGERIPPGEGPMTGDDRWKAIPSKSGNTQHLFLKPGGGKGMDKRQLIEIPSTRKAMFLSVYSDDRESSVFKVIFFAPQPSRIVVAYRPTPSVTPAPIRPKPEPTPRVLSIKSCDAPGMNSGYKWHSDSEDKMHRRIDLLRACDDGRDHTFFIASRGFNVPGAMPFQVDAGGRQDQLRNPVHVPATGDFPEQWVTDRVGPRWAFVADSSTGQIRTTVCRLPDTGCDGRR